MAVIEQLVTKAKNEGWGHYDGDSVTSEVRPPAMGASCWLAQYSYLACAAPEGCTRSKNGLPTLPAVYAIFGRAAFTMAKASTISPQEVQRALDLDRPELSARQSGARIARRPFFRISSETHRS